MPSPIPKKSGVIHSTRSQPAAVRRLKPVGGCGGCHTLQAAKSTGKVGPDLDKLPDYAQQAGQPLEQFVRESIVNPDAYVEKGFPANVMPKNFASLPKDQLDALVKYLVDSSKGAK